MGRKVIQVGNICALCQETYPRSVLYTCSQCRLIYCGNCVIFEEKGVVCLRCAVKKVTPRKRESKYMRLAEFLAKKARTLNEITLSFHEIEEIIGSKLPESARVRRSWWGNVRNRIPSEAWMTVGWTVKEVNLNEERVTFAREAKIKTKKELDEKIAQRGKLAFKALAYRARARATKRKLSKTKIAILQARLKNIERQHKR